MTKWIIQENLIAENDLNEIQNACTKLDVPFEEVKVIPFSPDLPDFQVDPDNIYYGSTTFMDNIYQELSPRGLFFNDKTFSMKNYIKQWGSHMLSSEAEVMPFGEFMEKDHDPESQWFLRPDADSKAFAGIVMTFGEVSHWFHNVMKCDSMEITKDTLILAGPPYGISKEWRNYIVNKKVITSTRYRENFRLSKSGTDIPQDMIDFVEERCKEYQPHDVFAMDIALCGGDYYIIECGCMNSVGFYHADIFEYVKSLTEYMRKTK